MSLDDDNARYAAAKADPVAAVVLDALHEQDARTYNGMSGDIAELSMEVAEKIRAQFADALAEKDAEIERLRLAEACARFHPDVPCVPGMNHPEVGGAR